MKTREIVIYGILSAVLLTAQVSLGFLPNIEIVTLLILVYTLVFRKKVFFIIYIFVFLEGLIYGFGLWWINYLYVWSIQALITLLFRKMIPYGSGVSSPGSMVLHSEHSVPSPTLQSAGFPVHLHIGRQDFYSISYTVSAISLYVSYCSNRSAMFWRNVYSRSNNISHITQESSCEPALYFYTYKSFSSSPICKITASAPAF